MNRFISIRNLTFGWELYSKYWMHTAFLLKERHEIWLWKDRRSWHRSQYIADVYKRQAQFRQMLYLLFVHPAGWRAGALLLLDDQHVGHRVTSHSVKVARKLVASNRYATTHIDWSDVNRSDGVRPFFRASTERSNRTGV